MRRGFTGLSMLIGIDKPSGMSSHDVVNRVRRVTGERRVGHTGTLDPFAEGVLPICVGPAARLDNYMTGHDKDYVVRIRFGEGTDTDDCTGAVVKQGAVPAEAQDPSFARGFLSSLVGKRKQIPPVYSAIKVDGKKACDEARKGRIIDLAPRDIEIYGAELIDIGEDSGDAVSWDVALSVSKGTYIRAIARDIGIDLGVPAHVSMLRRTRAGNLTADMCVTLDALERMAERGMLLNAALDPVKVLGYRIVFADDAVQRCLKNGNPVPAQGVGLCAYDPSRSLGSLCACASGLSDSLQPPYDGELVSMVADNALCALYAYDAKSDSFKSKCGFSTGVIRDAVSGI